MEIIGGRLDATRAALTGRVQVSDPTKLLLIRAAFRFRRDDFVSTPLPLTTPLACLLLLACFCLHPRLLSFHLPCRSASVQSK